MNYSSTKSNLFIFSQRPFSHVTGKIFEKILQGDTLRPLVFLLVLDFLINKLNLFLGFSGNNDLEVHVVKKEAENTFIYIWNLHRKQKKKLLTKDFEKLKLIDLDVLSLETKVVILN